MSSKTTKNDVHNLPIEKLFNKAKTIDFKCDLSTSEHERSSETTFTLFSSGIICSERKWFLSGSLLTENNSEATFLVDNPLQLLLALSANLFPQHFYLTYTNHKYKNCENMKLQLYIINVKEAKVVQWISDKNI